MGAVKSLRKLVSCQVDALPHQARMRISHGSGVNLVTYDGLGSGVGEASALVAELLELADVPRSRFQYRFHAPTESEHRTDPTVASGLHRSTIAALNAPDHLLAASIFPRVFAPSRHRIGVWHWEVDALPLPHRLAGPVTDEIWTTSVYQRDIMREAYRKPVAVLPLPVQMSESDPDLVRNVRRRVTSDPEALIYAFQFDWTSGRHRKNPEGVVEAYRRAFPAPAEGAMLLVKTINGSKHPTALADLRSLCGDRPDIVIIDEFWPKDVNAAFSDAIDCYVSLHRAEGFGLTIAKSMAAGKAVIATGFSGNLDFMPAGTSLLVPATPTRVGPGRGFPPEASWAEPDVDVAADMIRSVFTDARLRADLGLAGRQHMQQTRTLSQSVDWVRDRVASLP